MVEGTELVDVIHLDGQEIRRLREVLLVSSDDWSVTFRRSDGSYRWAEATSRRER